MASLTSQSIHSVDRRSRSSAACLHCGAEVGVGERFCCSGCEAVHRLLKEEHLDRYYALRGDPKAVCRVPSPGRDATWLLALEARRSESEGVRSVRVDIQGVHCTACVWLIEELFRREKGAHSIHVNSSTGRVQMVVDPSFDVRRYVASVERFGYVFGPPSSEKQKKNDDLVWRLGLSVALAMNAMIFGFAIYFGLNDGPIHRTFHALNFAFATINVFVCGSVFFRGAFEGLKRGVLHLDAPIALGMLVAFVGSLYSFALGDSTSSYFDTLNVFVTLMLLGRFIQARVLEKNKKLLLANDGIDHLYARKLGAQGIEIVAAKTIKRGDWLVLSRGDLLPVEAALEEERALFSMDWITGESAEHGWKKGDIIPAGSFSCDVASIRLRADRDFEASSIVPLLGRAAPRAEGALSFWQAFSKVYVLGVLALGVIAFASWFWATRDLPRTLNVVTAVLIGTCPCAFGIATPLAYEMVITKLRQHGLYARTDGLLDRLLAVRNVVFDKTGTLTRSELTISAAEIAALEGEERRILLTLAAHSGHPKASPVAEALRGEQPLEGVRTVETAGKGTELRYGGHVYRFGSPFFAAAENSANGDLVFAKDGTVRARFSTEEHLVEDAASEIDRLKREGMSIYLLTGDTEARARAIAEKCGIAPENVIAAQTPEAKAQWIKAHDHHNTLMVGDGINDTFAIETAYVSGTPATDRPFVASKADFFLMANGVLPIRRAMVAAKRLRSAVTVNLLIGVFYNLLALSLAFSGRMTPLLAAVFMPASSLSAISATVAMVSRRSTWKS